MRKRETWTPEDAAIFAAVEELVANTICSCFFQMRSLVGSSLRDNESQDTAMLKSQEVATTLMKQLKWPVWRDCGHCASPDQFCFIPIFPSGSMEDYYNPRCRGLDESQDILIGCYWLAGMGPLDDVYSELCTHTEE